MVLEEIRNSGTVVNRDGTALVWKHYISRVKKSTFWCVICTVEKKSLKGIFWVGIYIVKKGGW